MKASVHLFLSRLGFTFFRGDARIGAALLIAVALDSPARAACAVAGALSCALARRWSRPNESLAWGGLLEVNGFFLGLALASFFAPGPELAATVLLGGVLASHGVVLVSRLLAPWRLPVLLAPFLLVFWGIWHLQQLRSFLSAAPVPTPASALFWDSGGLDALPALALSGIASVAQIGFLASLGSGAALLGAIALSDRGLAARMLAGATAGSLGALALGAPWEHVARGYHGFNSALVAAAVTGSSARAILAALVAMPVGIASQSLMGKLGMPPLSLAYMLTAWAAALLEPARDAASAARERSAKLTAWGGSFMVSSMRLNTNNKINKSVVAPAIAALIAGLAALTPPQARADSDHFDLELQGAYDVPVPDSSDTALVEAATSQIEYKLRYFKTGGIERMKYDLPEELTGEHQSIEMKPLDATLTRWAGPNSEGTCAESAEGLRCQMKYSGLALDPGLARDAIQKRFGADPALAALKGRVMEDFQAEPNGVIRIPGAAFNAP